jgi:nicotinate phosphoribosyltransferase
MGNSESTALVATEGRLARHMLGALESSVLMTDGYKFAMAQAGDPLRPETFYLSFRRPGLYLLPFDLEALIARLLPAEPSVEELRFLARNGYQLSKEMREALAGKVSVWAAPQGRWVQEREPIVRISGPSFLVSWLEALVIWMQFPIQIATEAVLEGRRHFACTCEDEAAIVRLSLEAVGALESARVTVNARAYAMAVRGNARRLAEVLDGELARVFEVGMRGATCMQMHRIALSEIRKLGVAGSSNVHLAKELGMAAVGTSGHEHQLRFESEAAAFRALRDKRKAPPSYLFDTIDALELGIPAAVEVLRENPTMPASVRFDSGDTRAQVQAFVDAGVHPTFVFMDGIDDTKAAQLCQMQRELDAQGKPWLFGVGGYLVGRPSLMSLTRDRVSAVYKLCESGDRLVMKFSVPGKESIPGRTVVWRIGNSAGMQSVIAQEGERLGPGVRLATESSIKRVPVALGPPKLSKATQRLVANLRAKHFGSRGRTKQRSKTASKQQTHQAKGTQL